MKKNKYLFALVYLYLLSMSLYFIYTNFSKSQQETELVEYQKKKSEKRKKEPFCIDSDSGKNFEIKGHILALSRFGEREDYADYCTGKVLHEYFCENNEVEEFSLHCSPGCYDGRCLPFKAPLKNI